MGSVLQGFVIGNHDLVVGFRMVGVSGVEVTSARDAEEALSKALENGDVAIILVDEEFSVQLGERIQKHRLERVMPLIVEVPGKVDAAESSRLSELVGKSLGMRL